MQWQLLWYVLAGLIIGLTASTLWEWLYFRRKRMELRDQRVTELEAEVRLLRAQNRELVAATTRSAPIATDYHSPAVFLENEEAESLRDGTYVPQFDDVESNAPDDELLTAETTAVEESVVEEVRFVSLDPPTADETNPLPEAEADTQNDAEIDSVINLTTAPVPEPPISANVGDEIANLDVDETAAHNDGQGDEQASEEGVHDA